MNIIEKSTLIRQGKLGSTELCEDSLGRIAADDQDGLKLNSVSEINRTGILKPGPWMETLIKLK
jgi:hypothetical protein